jgi:hypothetical protein
MMLIPGIDAYIIIRYSMMCVSSDPYCRIILIVWSVNIYFRFRLKVNVGTLESETTFLLCDDVVRAIARDTFKTLMSLVMIFNIQCPYSNYSWYTVVCCSTSFFCSVCVIDVQCEGSSLYPIELDGLFGDPLLFKVNKRLKGHDPSFIEYDILGVFSDDSLLEIFLDPNHSAYGSLVRNELCCCLLQKIVIGCEFWMIIFWWINFFCFRELTLLTLFPELWRCIMLMNLLMSRRMLIMEKFLNPLWLNLLWPVRRYMVLRKDCWILGKTCNAMCRIQLWAT